MKSKHNVVSLYNKVKSFFSNNPDVKLNYKQLSKRLGITNKEVRRQVLIILQELEKQKFLLEISRGKYSLNYKKGIIEGILKINQHGIGVVTDENNNEVIIYPKYLHKALPGDRVKVRLFAQKKTGLFEGSILEIVERSQKPVLGTINKIADLYYLITDTRLYPYDILIPEENLNNAKTGQKVLVQIIEFPQFNKHPIGKVVEILGNSGEHNTEMHAILAEYGLPYKFSDEVICEVNNITEEISEEERLNRIDFTDVLTFTIDPPDAKDFDDAISFKKLENGLYEIGVHIADVSYYVKENTLVDLEAYKRGTSVYLVDRTIPMLPEKLSNNICSLIPGAERLCFSVVYVVDEDFNIKDYKICKTIIKNKRRFNYDEIQKIIETGSGEYSEEILKLNKFAKILRTKRIEKGAIVFGKVEVKFYLDEKGRPINVYFKEQKESNNLVEEFMLLANRTVAEFVNKLRKKNKKLPFVYRVHDKPDEEKLKKFAQIARKWGYDLKIKSKQNFVRSLNTMIENIKGRPEKDIIEEMAIRSMAKAIYSSKNIGHFGLAFAHYTHFTSPIRRYPDLMVHRLLDAYLNKKYDLNFDSDLESKCRYLSNREQIAADAERASIKYKQIEFMADKIGKQFIGLVISLTEWGIYVQIVDTKAEGMISLRSLDDDFYIYDEDKMIIKGKYHHKKFRLGDYVIVEIENVNLQKRHLDLSYVSHVSHI